MKNLISILFILAMTACGTGSNFSGGGSKATPQAKTEDAKPVKKPSTSDKLGKTTDKEETNELDDDMVSPEIDDDIKLPANAIVKGSFRAWTVPADPEPFVSYEIFIDVKLPSNTSNYSQDDLSGSVIGTDGYSQPIGRDALAIGFKGQKFDSLNGRATLILSVPGALNAVKDRINIKSDLLKESQTIEIVF